MIGKFAVLTVVLLGLLWTVPAQDKHTEQNLQPGIPYSISDIENINLTNGNLMFNFGFGGVSGRGSAAAGISLKYNSKLYESHVMTTLDVSQNMSPQRFLRLDHEGGWQYDSDYRLRVINRNDELDEPIQVGGGCAMPNHDGVYVWKLMMYLPDGSQHEFRPTGYSDNEYNSGGTAVYDGNGYFNVSTTGEQNVMVWSSDSSSACPGGTIYSTAIHTFQDPNPQMTYYSTDGTFMRLEIPNGQGVHPLRWTLYMPDGSRVTKGELDGQGNPLPQRIYDRNGNFVTKATVTLPDSSTAPGYIDQFGRYIARKTVSQTEDRIITLGVNGQPIEWIIRWKYISIIRKYTTSGTGSGPYRCCYSDQVLVARPKVVDEIELPAQLGGQKFVFDYNGHDGVVDWNQSIEDPNSSPGWGDLVGVILPSGAEAEYEYALSAIDAPFVFTDQLLPQLGKVAEKKLSYQANYDGNVVPVTDVWKYTISQLGVSSVVGPDGSVSIQYFGRTDMDNEFSGRVSREISPSGTMIERIWLNNKVGGCPQFGCGSMRRLNTYVKTEFTTIPDSAGNSSLTAVKDLEYDKNGNVIKVSEYDWHPYSNFPKTEGRITGIPGGLSPVRITENIFYNQTENASNSSANNSASYWNTTAPNVRRAIRSTEIKNGSGTPVSRTEIEYDNPSTTANPMTTKVWDSFKEGQYRAYSNPLTATNSISTSATYNQYGMPLTATDAKGNVTQITYGNISTGSGTVSDLYPTQTIAAYGTGLARTSAATYDFFTGAVLTSTDMDNNVTNAVEYDDLGRPEKSISALGTALESWTQTAYDDVNRRVVVRSDLETKGDGKKVATQFFDQLGRVRLTKMLEDSSTQSATNETDGIKVQTRYLSNGFTCPWDDAQGPDEICSGQLTSNPYRANYSHEATGEETMGWTLSQAQNTGRYSTVTSFSGASLPYPLGGNSNPTGTVTTEVDANTTTVEDQAGKKRRNVSNALGQLIRIDEPDNNGDLGSVSSPNQPTNYTYNALNNLLTVVQGSQTRTFVYSSLSRMTSETNPEAGTTAYEFDNNGNPTKKTDSRGVSTHFTYDALNRVTQKSYTGESGYTTPTITYTYDEYSNAIGRLTKVSSSISETKYTEFDKMGRVLESRQTTDGEHYDLQYTYNLAGMLVEQTYPSGRKVKNVIDNNGYLNIVQSRKNENFGYFNYAKNFTYNAAGVVTSMQLGNGRWQSNKFNSRMQMTQAALGTTPQATNLLKLDFDYGTDQNSGNLVSQTITVPTVGTEQGFTATQNYAYDSLNRLKSAAETISSNQTWKQTFVFDRYGNRNFDEVETTTLPKSCMDGSNPVMCTADRKLFNPSISFSTNRLNTSEDYGYDNAGNTTNDPQGRVFKYDGENKQHEVRNSQNEVIGQYFFDGNAKRVKKIVPSTGEVTVFVYDSAGRLSAEYSTQLSQDPKVSFITSDHLGSPRIKTDENGAVISRNDYLY
jgi:YD repeat-containing protein